MEPIQRRGRWWHQRADGSWLRWSEADERWEPQDLPPPPPEGGTAGTPHPDVHGPSSEQLAAKLRPILQPSEEIRLAGRVQHRRRPAVLAATDTRLLVMSASGFVVESVPYEDGATLTHALVPGGGVKIAIQHATKTVELTDVGTGLMRKLYEKVPTSIRVTGARYIPEDHPDLPVVSVSAGRTKARGSGVQYAGFWVRAAASSVDLAVAFAAWILMSLVLAFWAGLDEMTAEQEEVLGLILIMATIVAGWLYYAFMESSAQQGTLGKIALALRVTDDAGEPISFWRATGRYWGKFVSAVPLGFGFWMAAWTGDKQALHDLMARCLVVRR